MSTFKPIGWSNCHARRVARKSINDTLGLVNTEASSNALGYLEVTGIPPPVTKIGTQAETSSACVSPSLRIYGRLFLVLFHLVLALKNWSALCLKISTTMIPLRRFLRLRSAQKFSPHQPSSWAQSSFFKALLPEISHLTQVEELSLGKVFLKLSLVLGKPRSP